MSRNDERVKYRRAEASGFQQGGSPCTGRFFGTMRLLHRSMRACRAVPRLLRVPFTGAESSRFPGALPKKPTRARGGSLPIAALTDRSVGLFQPCVSLLPVSLETGSVLDPIFQKRGLRTHWLSGLYRAGYLPDLDAECNPVFDEPIPIIYESEADRVHEIIDGTIVHVGPYDASCPCHEAEAGASHAEGRTAA